MADSARPAVRIALLRAVNLGPHNKVGMADLRALLEELGLGNPRSLLVSGNLLFDSDRTPAQLEPRLERAAKERLGLQTEFMVRTAEEWKTIIAGNPFPKEARADPGHLVVLCCKDAPTAQAVSALREAISGRERIETKGREAYLVYPDGIGRSRLTSALIEKHLRTRGTGRNWNTVLKLAALAAGP